jgi:hypothetical protein
VVAMRLVVPSVVLLAWLVMCLDPQHDRVVAAGPRRIVFAGRMTNPIVSTLQIWLRSFGGCAAAGGASLPATHWPGVHLIERYGTRS